jgi:hypothetical protein
MSAVYMAMGSDEVLASLTVSDWDEGNLAKNREKRQVSALECEQVFLTGRCLHFQTSSRPIRLEWVHTCWAPSYGEGITVLLGLS